MIESELGERIDTLFTTFNVTPVAAASLGQVYYAVLRNTGKEVAVKVQRPGVYDCIALDVHILRKLATFLKTYRKFNSDLPKLIDDWAASLF